MLGMFPLNLENWKVHAKLQSYSFVVFSGRLLKLLLDM